MKIYNGLACLGIALLSLFITACQDRYYNVNTTDNWMKISKDFGQQ